MGALNGLRIVVTRAAHQAEELAAPLRERGADVILLPVIGIAPPSDDRPLQQAASQADRYDWIIFTSANAITAFVSKLEQPARTISARIAVVGAATCACAERAGFTVSLTPHQYVAEALVESFGSENLSGKRLLIPSAAVTRDIIGPALRAQGAEVDMVEAYRNVIPEGAAACVSEVFREPLPHWVTFASSSAVDNLVSLTGTQKLARTKIASIGPVTSASVDGYGLTVAAEAMPHTIAGLVEGLVAAIHTAKR